MDLTLFSDDDESRKCRICLELYENSDVYNIWMVECGHSFGRQCIEECIKNFHKYGHVYGRFCVNRCIIEFKSCPQCKKKRTKKEVHDGLIDSLQTVDVVIKEFKVRNVVYCVEMRF